MLSNYAKNIEVVLKLIYWNVNYYGTISTVGSFIRIVQLTAFIF